jgi:hypothetical protein
VCPISLERAAVGSCSSQVAAEVGRRCRCVRWLPFWATTRMTLAGGRHTAGSQDRPACLGDPVSPQPMLTTTSAAHTVSSVGGPARVGGVSKRGSPVWRQ